MTSNDWKEIANVARLCGHAHAPTQVAFAEFAARCEGLAEAMAENVAEEEAPEPVKVTEPAKPQPAAPKIEPPKPAAIDATKNDTAKAN